MGAGISLAFSAASWNAASLSPNRTSDTAAVCPSRLSASCSGIRQGQTGRVQLASVQSLVIRAVQGVVIAGIAGLDEQRIAVVQRKCGFLCGGKVCFPLLAQFCQMFVQCGDQFMGRTCG